MIFIVRNNEYVKKDFAKLIAFARLNVQKMFEMFINDCPELTHIVKYSFYLSYFKENFDYSFGRPHRKWM